MTLFELRHALGTSHPRLQCKYYVRRNYGTRSADKAACIGAQASGQLDDRLQVQYNDIVLHSS